MCVPAVRSLRAGGVSDLLAVAGGHQSIVWRSPGGGPGGVSQGTAESNGYVTLPCGHPVAYGACAACVAPHAQTSCEQPAP